jgi:hypothetical protein
MTQAERVLHRAKQHGKSALALLTQTAKDAPANAKTAAVLIAKAAAELREIAKEKAPGLAENAVSTARAKLAKILPFTASEAREPVVAAAE